MFSGGLEKEPIGITLEVGSSVSWVAVLSHDSIE